MRVVLAPDSFKESMTATRAAEAMAAGVHAVLPDARCVPVPMADGGEGTVLALGGSPVPVPVAGPLGDPVQALLGWQPERRLAVVESAQAVGMHLVPPGERDILRADSGGVGTLVRAALDLGADRIVIGLGGTLTSDGGAGLLRELGARLLDDRGAELPPGAPVGLAALDAAGLEPRLRAVRIELACDVRNPLLGPRGAAAVFAAQKGATGAQLPVLEAALGRMAAALDRAGFGSVADRPGAGAAGGLGAALLALGARMRPGVQVVAEAVGLAEAVAGADLVLTGEGRVDRQTLDGKVPAGVCAVAAAAGVRVVVLGGSVDPAADLSGLGALAVREIAAGLPLAEALRRGPELLERATAAVLRELARDPRPGGGAPERG